MAYQMSGRCKEAILVSIVAFIGLAALLANADRWTYSDPHFAMILDHHKYIYMARNNPFDFHIAPFCWRVLNPLLAKTLPFEIATAFAVVTFAALWLTAVVLYFMSRRMGFSSILALIGLLFFLTLGWATRFNLNDFWLSDPLGFLFSTAALWSIVARKDIPFAVLLAIGVMAKESVIFLAPLYYTLNTRKLIDPKLLYRSLVVVSPAIIILILLRVAITPLNGNAQYLATLGQNLQDANPYPYNVALLFQSMGWPRIQQLSIERIYTYTIGTFGVSMSFLALLSVKDNLLFLVRVLPFVLLTYSSLLFATDTSRLIVGAFPAIIPMALYGIGTIIDFTGIDERVFVSLPLIIFVLLFISKDLYLISGKVELLVALAYLALILLSKQRANPMIDTGERK